MNLPETFGTTTIKAKIVQCEWCFKAQKFVYIEETTTPGVFRCQDCSHLNTPTPTPEDTSAEYNAYCLSQYEYVVRKFGLNSSYEDFLLTNNFKKEFFEKKVNSLSVANTTTEKTLIKHLDFWGHHVLVRLKSVKIYVNSYQWQIDRLFSLNPTVSFLE